MYNNTTGSSNVAVGADALKSNTEGANITAVGYQCLDANTTGVQNTALGDSALGANTTGSTNVSCGIGTLDANTTASNNTAVGAYALSANTTGEPNTAVGRFAMVACTTGGSNVAIGKDAAVALTTGGSNTIIGVGSAATLTTGSSNILIGKEANVSSAGNSELVIGNSVSGVANNTGLIYPPGGGGIYQATNGTSFLQTSDERIKKNIVDNNEGLNKLKDIQVRNFEYRTEDEIEELPSHLAVKKEGIQLGVIAQEIEKVLPEVVTIESSGVKTVNADNLTWYLINAVQELSTQVDELKQNSHKPKGLEDMEGYDELIAEIKNLKGE